MTMRKNYEELNKIQKAKFEANENRLWEILNKMTFREIALSSMTVIAKEAGLSRNAIYNHPSVYQHILMCRTKEEERIQQLESKKYAE